MAVLTISDEGKTIEDSAEISAFLETVGVWYRRFEGDDDLSEDATDDEILAAYADPIDQLKAEGGYITADVINIVEHFDGLDALLAKFAAEHWHDEDEVRFIVKGRGIFHFHPKDGPVFALQVAKGDMINVPKGTLHWFDLCEEKIIRAIRLFQTKEGWTPRYTESGVDEKYAPLCFGPEYLPPGGGMTSSVI